MLELIALFIADIEVIAALVLAIIFTAGYVIFFNWRKTAAGRAIFYLFASLIVVSALSFLAVWISPDYWLRPVWRALGWGFVVFSLVNLLWVLWKSFRQDENPLATIESRHTDEIPTITEKEEDHGTGD